MTQHLVVVSAGLSVPSSTRLLADRLTEAVRAELPSATVEFIELRELATAIANHLVTGFPNEPLHKAIESVSSADGLIAVTPVFAASYSGLFKSFFDLIDPDALTGTPTLIAATGGTPRHSLALDHAIRPLFSYLHALTVPTSVFAASEDWGGEGDAFTAHLPGRIKRAASELAAQMRTAGPRTTPADDLTPFAQQLSDLRFD
ncbi:oxidoreductase [Streptomyces spiroverticillatus]|uniref:Oxidoreductase n=1 Tax=Streptomyces finlayi TaxID=67296 RepID=A0A919C8K3_9ACTN|nr:FMN reductase [Streptomyces finlayi]GGZ98363.1 oxidoreductase [Streptomyces spiroverticillatus]GHC83276.1 oxidoreductase [Streptomyces finlayi]